MSLAATIPNEDEYQFWFERSKIEYANEKMRANHLSESEAKALSESSFARLLPQQLETPDQYIRVIKDEEQQLVGFYWLAAIGAPDNRKGFIYDIVVEESMRGKGHGRAMMNLIEALAKDLKLARIALHVFASNKTAVNLYQSMGYETTDLVLEKAL